MWPSSWNARSRCERDAAADVDVRRGDVDAELHAQRPAERQLLLELPLGQDVDGVAGQLGDRHGSESRSGG